MTRAVLALALLITGSVGARAETLYVTDVLVVLLRAAPGPQAATVKQLTSGAALEVLDRRGGYTQVRDAQGASGWVEARYVVADRPAGARLAEAQAELARAKARVSELERRLSDPAPAPSPPPSGPAPAEAVFAVPLLWLWISSAMLIIGVVGGFIGGVSWLRARTRRKLGGMTINIRNL